MPSIGENKELNPPERPIGVFLIADNRLIRETLAKLLCKHGFEVIAGVPFGEGVLDQIASCGPDVLVMDATAAVTSPFNFISQARRKSPEMKVVLIGMDENRERFLASVKAGVIGYVGQDGSAMDVVSAVKGAAKRRPVCPPALLLSLFEYVAQEWAALPNIQLKAGLGLTRREQQLIPLIALGLTNKEIGARFFLSEQTVKNHIHRMLRKLGASDRLTMLEYCRTQSISA